jgi:hypothetical protein
MAGERFPVKDHHKLRYVMREALRLQKSIDATAGDLVQTPWIRHLAPYYCGFKDFMEATANMLQYMEVSATVLIQSHITVPFNISPVCFGIILAIWRDIRGCSQKSPDGVDNEIYTYNNKHSLRSNTKGYGGKTHWTDSQNSDTTAHNGTELHHLQFSLQEASPETF